MNFGTKNFFVGLMDFFSIILPGTALTCLLQLEFAGMPNASWIISLTSTAGWLAFLFFSYGSGHLLFLLWAFMDDGFCGRIRMAMFVDTVKHLAKGGKPAPFLARFLANEVFGWNDRAVKEAIEIKDNHLAAPMDMNAINTFQWCTARLVRRIARRSRWCSFEADSKFFRSFSVLLVLLCAGALVKGSWAMAALGAALSIPTLYRYL